MNIKFRGQRVDGKGWLYGYVVPLGKLSFSDPDRFGIAEEAIPVGFASIAYNLEIIEVIPETIGKYTGLKDKNGVEIYEGDVISYRGMAFEIKWDGENGRFLGFENKKRPDGKNYICYVGTELIKSEVVGSIHDNPELMEVQNESE